MTTVPRLILVTDRRTARFPLQDLAERAVAGGVDVVQVRERDLDLDSLMRITGLVAAAVTAERTAVNGAPIVASRLGIHLHLPEASPLPPVGRPVPWWSRSVHSVESARETPDCRYLIAGHVFPTGSHAGVPPLGLEGLSEIVGASPYPVIAIGGLSPERVASVVDTGAAGIAVMSYVNSSPRPEDAARELREALDKAMHDQAMISIELNGKPFQLPLHQTITDLLRRRQLSDRLVAVERNGAIVPKSLFSSTVIQPGDVIEIAHFVGGG